MTNHFPCWTIVAVCSIIYFPLFTGGLMCVQCSKCRNSYPKATECSANMTYCLKIVTEDGEAVERKCSPTPKNETKSICIETFDRDTTCKHYCNNKDGCNMSPAALAPQQCWIFLFLALATINNVPPLMYNRKLAIFAL